MSVEFRIEIWHGNINLRVISIQIAYKAVRLDEITEEASVKKNEREKIKYQDLRIPTLRVLGKEAAIVKQEREDVLEK